MSKKKKKNRDIRVPKEDKRLGQDRSFLKELKEVVEDKKSKKKGKNK